MLRSLSAWCVGRPIWTVAGLLLVLLAEIGFSIPRNSQTFDESVHLLSGYQYWRHRDFGANPEHPPLLKLAASAPLMLEPLNALPVLSGPTKASHSAGAIEFLYRNTVPVARLLFEARMAASVFVCVLLVLMFLVGRDMFDTTTGLMAAALFAFEPNMLANGPLITTDVAMTLGLFLVAFAGYRYASRPSTGRLALFGFALFVAVASKHSAVLLAAIVPVLMLADLVVVERQGPYLERLRRRCLALVAAAGMAFVGLWAIYTFRYAARPEGVELNRPGKLRGRIM